MLETLCRHLDMVRLSAAGVFMMALVACTGLVGGGSDGMSPQQKNAIQAWQQKALPVLKQDCISCHNGSRAGVGFLAGAEDMEIRDNLMAFTPSVVNLEAASSSQIVTKDLHEGPRLTDVELSAMLDWLFAERDAANHNPDMPVQQLQTPPMAVQLCTAGDPGSATCPTNHIALDGVPTDGTKLTGAEITFTAQAVGSSLYLSRLSGNGGTTGFYFEHLLFVSLPAMANPFPDQIDRYFALKFNIGPGKTSTVGGGTEDFIGFAPTDMISLHFKLLSTFKPDTGGTKTDGCKVVDKFTTNAMPELTKNCTSCHSGQNTTATAAMDLTTIGTATTDPAKILTACNQVRSRINTQTPDQSGFYIAPNTGTNHPFKFPSPAGETFATFKTAMDVWVTAEKTAP